MNKVITDLSARNKVYAIISIELAVLLILAYIAALIIDPFWKSQLFLVHSILELFCILISFSIFIVTWNNYGKKSYAYRIIGLLFLAISIIDILHTFYYQTYLFRYYYCKNMTSGFWMLGRLIEAAALLGVVLGVQSFKITKRKTLSLVSLVIVIAGVSVFSIPFAFKLRVAKGMTASEIIMELLIVFIIIIAFAVLIIYKNINARNYKHLFIAILLAATAEINFLIYSNKADPFYPEIGHVLRIIYYLYLFKAVFSNVAEYPYIKMESALNLSENLFKIAFDNAPIGIGLISIDGELVKVNNALCEFLGYSESELLEMSYDDLLCSGDKSMFDQVTNRLIDDNLKSLSFEKDFRLNQERTVWARINISLVKDTAGNSLYFIVQSEDITDRKKAEELTILTIKNQAIIKENAELERLRTEFFANLSHEFRTPLNVIHCALQLIELNMNKDKEIALEKINANVKVMKQNCLRLLRLVNNLIDITKIDAGLFQLNLNNYNIVSIIEDITLSAAEYVKNKGVYLIFDTDVEEKVIMCDPDRIERIILNVISNSLKFTDKGGLIKVNIHDKKNNVEIVIEDTGIGIPEDKIGLIFERFWQVDNSTTKNNEGSGIGLSIVRSLVEMHSGTVTLESKLGEGSRVIISIPSKVNDYDCIPYCTFQSNHIERINVEFSDIYFNDK